MADHSAILEQLKVLIADELQAVSYKTLARKFNVPANVAKQLLFQFVNSHRERVSVTYLLAGWTRGEDGVPPAHTVALAAGEGLAAQRARLASVTSLHVYSVQPSQPNDAAKLWNNDREQLAELFAGLLAAPRDSCLGDNRLSAVDCSQARASQDLRVRRPAAPAAAEAQPAAAKTEAPAKPAAGPSAARTPAVQAAAAPAPAKPVAASGKPDSKQEGSAAPAGAKAAAAAAAAAAPRAGGASAAANQKGGAHLSKMWGKAPAKKPAAKKAPAPKAAPKAGAAAQRGGAADADAALRLAQPEEAASSSDSEGDEDAVLAAARGRKRGKFIDDDDSPVKPARSVPRAAAEQPAEAPAPAPAAAAPPPDSDGAEGDGSEDIAVEMDVEEAAAAAPAPASQEDKAAAAGPPGSQGTKAGAGGKGSQAARGQQKGARPPSGTVRVRDDLATGEPKRRKVVKTTYNDKGEEVTTVEWQDEAAPSGAPPASAPAAGAVEKPALAERPANGAAAKAASAPAGKKAGPKGKAPPAGQRGIKSFFAKPK